MLHSRVSEVVVKTLLCIIFDYTSWWHQKLLVVGRDHYSIPWIFGLVTRIKDRVKIQFDAYV